MAAGKGWPGVHRQDPPVCPAPGRRQRRASMREDRASVTAERNAWVRAVESNKPEGVRLFYDPYARYFLGPELRSIYEDPARTKELLGLWEQTVPGVPGSVLVRTAFIDRLLRACLDDEFQQVVILGAGYDTRAYRFSARDHRRLFSSWTTRLPRRPKRSAWGAYPENTRNCWFTCRWNSNGRAWPAAWKPRDTART